MRKPFLILFAGLLSVVAAVAADPAGGILQGVVVNSKDAPVARAAVFVQSADGTSPRAYRTDARGNFHIPYLRMGLYDVRAEGAGMWSEWNHNVVIRSGKSVNVKLKLVRSEPPPAPPRQ
jgi:hypothetical protein